MKFFLYQQEALNKNAIIKSKIKFVPFLRVKD